MNYVISILGSYLLGSVIFGYVIGKWGKGVDVRKHGSGNAGATNTLRVLGVGPGVLVLILDLLKAVLAVWLGRWLAPDEIWVAAACSVAVVIGHNWPVFFGFKGGKGIASTIGAACALSFFPAGYAVIITLLVIAITRYVSLGSLSFAVSLPIFIWIFHDEWELLLAVIVLGLLAFYRHRTNIVRLIQGQERKLGSKS